jgi:hypothetical protein
LIPARRGRAYSHRRFDLYHCTREGAD